MRRFKQKKIGYKDKGQTAVEYLLLMAAVIVIVITLTKKLHMYLLPNGECKEGSTSPLCMLQGAWNPPSFKYFTIRRYNW